MALKNTKTRASRTVSPCMTNYTVYLTVFDGPEPYDSWCAAAARPGWCRVCGAKLRSSETATVHKGCRERAATVLEQFKYGCVSGTAGEDGWLVLSRPRDGYLGVNKVEQSDAVPIGNGELGLFPSRLPVFQVGHGLFVTVDGAHTAGQTIGKIQDGRYLLQRKTVVWETTDSDAYSDFPVHAVLEFRES
jgi:hypothetical protein